MNEETYIAVKNQEEQFSIWPADLALPSGWQALPVTGPKAVCLAYVSEQWTDMRPASLR